MFDGFVADTDADIEAPDRYVCLHVGGDRERPEFSEKFQDDLQVNCTDKTGRVADSVLGERSNTFVSEQLFRIEHRFRHLT